MTYPHPLYDLENKTKRKVQSGGATVGYFLVSGSPMMAEACSTLPLDWLIVDMEASPVTKEGAMHISQALNGSGVTPLIRVPTCDRHLIEHALDIGAHGILVPKVETVEEARRVVQACRFPPEGARGVNPIRASAYFGNLPAYFEKANQRTLCMIQIESPLAVANAESLAAVEGIDGLFIGAGDLACALGQPGIVTGASMDAARSAVLNAARTHGKVPGIFAYSMDLACQYLREGFLFVAFGNEIKALREVLTANLERLWNESLIVKPAQSPVTPRESI